LSIWRDEPRIPSGQHGKHQARKPRAGPASLHRFMLTWKVGTGTDRTQGPGISPGPASTL